MGTNPRVMVLCSVNACGRCWILRVDVRHTVKCFFPPWALTFDKADRERSGCVCPHPCLILPLASAVGLGGWCDSFLVLVFIPLALHVCIFLALLLRHTDGACVCVVPEPFCFRPCCRHLHAPTPLRPHPLFPSLDCRLRCRRSSLLHCVVDRLAFGRVMAPVPRPSMGQSE